MGRRRGAEEAIISLGGWLCRHQHHENMKTCLGLEWHKMVKAAVNHATHTARTKQPKITIHAHCHANRLLNLCGITYHWIGLASKAQI